MDGVSEGEKATEGGFCEVLWERWVEVFSFVLELGDGLLLCPLIIAYNVEKNG